MPGLEALFVVAAHVAVQTTTRCNIPKQPVLSTVSQLSLRMIGSCCCVSRKVCDGAASQGFQRRRRNQIDTPERRADRAQSLIMMGEVARLRREHHWRQRRGTLWTSCKIQCGGQPLHMPHCPTRLQHHRAKMAFALDKDLFVKNLRCGRRGAAAGVSGMTS